MTSTTTTTNNGNNTNGGGPPLTSDDLEEVLLELNRFEKSPAQNIPNILERYLVFVAKTGSANFPWTKVKPLFRSKLENVIMDFSNLSPADEVPPVPNVDVFNFAAIRNKVFEQLDAFAGIPFTVQRLAELLTSPRRHYKRTDKFMRALEKNMLIVSTVEARANNNNDSESRNSYLMNGDYLSNGNGVNKNNSNEELATTQQTLQRDNVEDDLDAEMPQSPPTSASTANLMIPTNGSLNSPLTEAAATTTAAVVTEPIPDGLNKPPEETIEDEMVTDQDMITDDDKTPDTSNPISDAKRIRLDDDTKHRSEVVVEPSTSNANEAAQATHEEQSKTSMEVVVSNDDVESIPSSSSSEPAAVAASTTDDSTEVVEAKKVVDKESELSSNASSSTQLERDTPPTPPTQETAKESPTQNSDDTSNVISSTEETSEKASEKTSDAATIATNAETSSPVTAAETSSTEPNNEASTSE